MRNPEGKKSGLFFDTQDDHFAKTYRLGTNIALKSTQKRETVRFLREGQPLLKDQRCLGAGHRTTGRVQLLLPLPRRSQQYVRRYQNHRAANGRSALRGIRRRVRPGKEKILFFFPFWKRRNDDTDLGPHCTKLTNPNLNEKFCFFRPVITLPQRR